MVKVHAVLPIATLTEIIANVKARGFGQENIKSGMATAVLDFDLPDGSEMLTLLNRGEWS